MFFSEQDFQFMQCAIELAKLAEKNGEVPVGAVVTLDNEIIGEGWNQPIRTNDPTAHAEIIALRNAAQKLQNYRIVATTLYVTLEPCVMCVGAMIHARIKRLVFGAYDSKAGAVVSVCQLLEQSQWNHHFNYEGGLLAEQSSELLKKFFKQRR